MVKIDKHTPPIPWTYTKDTKAEMFSIHTEGFDPVDCSNKFIACGIWYECVKTGKAIAELIVRSVNDNQKLRTELRQLIKKKRNLETWVSAAYECLDEDDIKYIKKAVIIRMKNKDHEKL